MIYAANYPARGAVSVDSPFDIRPFARLVQQLAPALRGPGFAAAFAPIQRSMRLDLLPAPVAQDIRQDVVLGYWDELLRTDPERMHLVEADRFAARLRSFVASVTAVGGPLERDALEHVGDGLAGVDC